MTTDKNTLKSWFLKGKKPLEAHFAAWIDSYWHKTEQIPTSSIQGLEATLNNKTETAETQNIRETIADIADGTTPVEKSRYAEKLGTEADHYTKTTLDDRLATFQTKTGDGQDITVAFTPDQTENRENIASEENLSGLFGKIARWFADLKAVAFSANTGDLSETGDKLFFTQAERNKLTNIADGANAYTHPASHSASMIEPTADRLFVTPADKANWNNKADLDGSGKVPASQLPSYVDDVLTYASMSAFPGTGEDGKIYIAADTNRQYRWSGSAYVEISASLALGETPSTAYRGDRGKIAYDYATTQRTIGEIENLQGILDGKLNSDADSQNFTVTFTQAGERQDINSGETLSVLFGKIKKWFSSLGTLAFKNTVALSEIDNLQNTLDGKADATHTHPISKIDGLQDELNAKAYGTTTTPDNGAGTPELVVNPFPENTYGCLLNVPGTGTMQLFQPHVQQGIPRLYFRSGFGGFDRFSAWEKVVGESDSRLTNARPSSDVHDWAKQPAKPGYSPAEIGALPIQDPIISGAIRINPTLGSYAEGIRIATVGGWSNIQFAADPDSPSGTIDGQWLIGRNPAGAFSICQAGTETSNPIPTNGLGISPNNAGLYFNGRQVATTDQLPTTLPANGGNADTVDGLHAAATGQIEGGKLASYDNDGYFNAKIFRDNWAVENTNIAEICYRYSATDGYHRFCTVAKLKEIMNVATADQIPTHFDNLYVRKTGGTYTGYVDFPAGAGNSGSDMRFKTDVAPLENILDDLLELQIISYTWTKEGETRRNTFGLSATQLMEKGGAFQKIVHERNDQEKTKWVEYDRIGILAVKALQELHHNTKQENAALKQEMKNLRQELSELRESMESLKTTISK